MTDDHYLPGGPVLPADYRRQPGQRIPQTAGYGVSGQPDQSGVQAERAAHRAALPLPAELDPRRPQPRKWDTFAVVGIAVAVAVLVAGLLFILYMLNQPTTLVIR